MPGNTPDLIATYWTIAGDVVPLGPPEREASAIDCHARVEATHRAGYRGLGLIQSDLVHVRRQDDFASMRAILADNAMRHLECKFLTGWLEDGVPGQTANTMLADLCEAAAALGARHLKVGPDMQARAGPLEHMITHFHALCRRARGAGIAGALAIMPWSNLRTMDDGLAVVAGADVPNGGLLRDIWHVARAGVPYSDIAKVPAQYLRHIAINDADAAVVGSLREDTLDRRRLYGAGALNVVAFVEAVQAAGYDRPYGVKILSSAHCRLGLDKAARVSFDTALSQFTA